MQYPQPCSRLPPPHASARDSWTLTGKSRSVSCGGHRSFLLGRGAHKILFVPSKSCLSITNYQSLLKLMSVESVMPSNHFILCCPLFLLPSLFPSLKVFSNELVLHIRWPKYWSFSFSISPSNDYLGLVSFRINCFDLLAVQGTLKHLLKHHSSKASVLRCSAVFMIQLSHL